MFRLAIVCPKCRQRFVVLDELEAACAFNCPSCGELALHIQKTSGFVYILSNGSMPGIVKIGFTERTVAERISELSAHTGVAVPYEEEASFPVTDPIKFERFVHDGLSDHRVSQNREFFRLSPEQAIAAVRKILGISPPTPQQMVSTAKLATPVSTRDRLAEELKAQGINLGGFGSSKHEERV